ncbi:MAG: LPS assembly lipoprotein LptE [Brumimicrobium sp.]
MKSLFILFGLLLMTACWPTSLSFQDGSVPPEWKRFMVSTLENEASNAPISYAPELTELIKDAVQNRVGLELVSNESDDPQVTITGVVSNYNVAPMAMQGDDVAAKNRLTINANFEIFISEPEEDLMELSVSRFADFDSNQDVGAIQAQLLEEINDQIVQDVLNKLLSNW